MHVNCDNNISLTFPKYLLDKDEGVTHEFILVDNGKTCYEIYGKVTYNDDAITIMQSSSDYVTLYFRKGSDKLYKLDVVIEHLKLNKCVCVTKIQKDKESKHP